MFDVLLPPWTVDKLLCLWKFPGKNTGADCHFLPQGIIPTQVLNPHLLCLLNWPASFWPLMPPGNPFPWSQYGKNLSYNIIIYFLDCPFQFVSSFPEEVHKEKAKNIHIKFVSVPRANKFHRSCQTGIFIEQVLPLVNCLFKVTKFLQITMAFGGNFWWQHNYSLRNVLWEKWTKFKTSNSLSFKKN